MKFVQNFLHPRHIAHAPHKWLFATLLSPIHAGQVHYKKRYHLRYNHAKKLFVFDLLLVLASILLFALTLWWYLYDPTVTANVHVNLEGPTQRIVSGENITIAAQYENNSDVELTNVSLSFTLPEYATLVAPTDATITLPDLAPGDQGDIPITFEYLTSPDAHDDVVAKLSYMQADVQTQEIVMARRTLVASESSIIIEVTNPPTQVAANSELPITMQFTNTGDDERIVRAHEDVAPGITFVPDDANEVVLEANQSFGISGRLLIGNIPREPVELLFSPVVITSKGDVLQHGTKSIAQVIAPDARISSSWADNVQALAPGQSGNLEITVANVGDIPLSNLRVTIPGLSPRISRNALRNYGSITNDTLTITSNYDAGLLSIAPGSSHTLTIPIQIVSGVGAQNTLTLTSRVSAPVANTNITVTDSAESSAIQLGGSVDARVRSWYYTPEGDQLGRGPLPPRVGEETKYWVSVSAKNGSSNLSGVRIQGSLAPGVRFTGKTSVTAGSDITYDEASRTWVYTLSQLSAGAGLGIHMELAVTPSDAAVGAHLPLVTDILLKANDNYINVPITQSLPDVTTALIGDERAAARGTRVVN